MTDFGWTPALIMVLGITLVVGGIVAFVSELVRRSKAHRRDMRKFLAKLPAEERGRFAVGMDAKPLIDWNEDIQ